MTHLHRELQPSKDVLHLGLEHFWSQFTSSYPHLVGEEHHLQAENKCKQRNPVMNATSADNNFPKFLQISLDNNFNCCISLLPTLYPFLSKLASLG